MEKYIAIILTINCMYIWVMIILGTLQIFGDNLLSMLIVLPALLLNCYVHIKAYISIEEESKKKP